MADPSSASLEQLVDRVLAGTARGDRSKVFPPLIRAATTPERVMLAFVRLLRAGGDGPRLGLEFAARLPDPIPPELVRAVVPMLSARPFPVAVRIAAAAKVLAAVPDAPEHVTPVVRGITTGLNRVKALERLTRLQARVEVCESLDVAVAHADRLVKFKCPKCPARLKKSDFVAHLWEKHRLILEANKARDPHGMVDATITAAATSAKGDDLDHAFQLSQHYYPAVTSRQVFQALVARGTGDPTQTDLLLQRAAEERAGVCPVCLTAVPDPIPALLPAASVAEGRVAAEGYAVDLRETPNGRIVTIESPTKRDSRYPDASARRSPRLAAASIAAGVFLVAIVLMILVPLGPMPPILMAFLLVSTGWVTYLTARYLWKPVPKLTRRVLEIAWSDLVPEIGRTKSATRFLTRFCRASLETGDPATRSSEVHDLVETAADRADKSPAHQQLFAVARVLQATDLARMGRERVGALAKVFEPFFRGEVSPTFAEGAAEAIVTDTELPAGDRERLAVLLLEGAFEAGLMPSDLTLASRFLPFFRKLLCDWRGEHLAHLYAAWRLRPGRTWENVGPADTVFDLAEQNPTLARRLLRDKPDAVWLLEFHPDVEAAIGPVIVTPSGMFIRGYTVAEGTFELVKLRTGAFALRVGRQIIELNGKVSTRIVGQLNNWLRYRAGNILPLADHALRTRPGPQANRLLLPLAVACPLCGTYCLHRTGKLGTPWQAIG